MADRNRRAGDRRSPAGTARDQQQRTLVAQQAARLIVEHGLADWNLAKRKAMQSLMIPESAPLPSNDELEAALIEHQALYGGEALRRSLRRQREAALEWMRRMQAWDPMLVGGVAAGWAGAHADVRIELVADDAKAVEIALAGLGIAYRSATSDASAGTTELVVAEPAATIRLSIVNPNIRRSRPRHATQLRLGIDEVRELLA